MFIGHYAPALALGSRTDAPPLWSLFVAAQLTDYLFFTLVFPGLESAPPDPTAPAALPFALDAPITHSLVGSAGIALAAGALFALAAPAGRRAAWSWIGAAVTLSHWFMDWLVHRPDLPLAPGMEPLGLGLWYRPLIAWPLELGLLAAGTWLYARAVPARAKAAWALAAFMAAVQIAARLGPPAESITALSPTALFGYTLFALLAGLFLREPKTAAA
jgi:hypothetical protein